MFNSYKFRVIILNILKLFFKDFVLEIIYFPLWWYSFGLYQTGVFCLGQIKKQWNNLGISISLKFLFKPMYAQNDFAGRIISFFARLIQLILKFFVFLFIIFFFILIFIFWIALPLIVVWQIKINYSSKELMFETSKILNNF